MTPVTFVPPGYQPDLDRLPPRSHGGCLRLLGWSVVGLVVLAIIVAIVISLISSGRGGSFSEPITLIQTRTLQPTSGAPFVIEFIPNTPAPDSWSLTGTALYHATYTPTLDYCWFLTPSPTSSPTGIMVTPDAWQMTGTAVYLQTGTPTSTPTSTQAPPRAWCDLQTPTITPLPPRRELTPQSTTVENLPLYLESPTLRPTNTPTPRPSSTLFPTFPPRESNSSQVEAPPAPVAPVVTIIQAPPVVNTVIYFITVTPMPTSTPTQPEATDELIPSATFTPSPTLLFTEAPIPTETPYVIIITATPSPTDVPTETPVPPTDVPTNTPAPTETPVPPTDVPTNTPAPTETPVPPTDVPTNTPTPIPTASPLLAIVGGDCLPGYPQFVMTNFGMMPGEPVNWSIELIGTGITSSGQLWPELSTASFVNVNAAAWSGVPGSYLLTIYQPWEMTPTITYLVTCSAAPTLVPTSTTEPATMTHTPTFTWTPTNTPTPTETVIP